jgi:hypothetical protein
MDHICLLGKKDDRVGELIRSAGSNNHRHTFERRVTQDDTDCVSC